MAPSLLRGDSPIGVPRDFSAPNRRATDGRRIPPLLKLTMPVGVLRTLADYRDAAGAARVIEVGYGFEEYAGRTILQGMRNEAESFSSSAELGRRI